MFKILLAVDGSPAAQEGLDLAATLFAGQEAEILLFHVIARHLIYGKGGPVVAECYDPAEQLISSTALLEDCREQLRKRGIGLVIKTELATGDPADLIMAMSEREGSDMIILGSRGLNALQRFMLGSVSMKVSSHAHCPVLVVHPKQHAINAALTGTRAQTTV